MASGRRRQVKKPAVRSQGFRIGDVEYGAEPAGRRLVRQRRPASRRPETVTPGCSTCRLDGPAGPLVGVLPVRSTGGFGTWQEQSVKLPHTVTGTHDVHLVVAGGAEVAAVDWLTFRR
ncbi:carbohydrate-binding protein [Streptomyces sp. NPDC057557]|uniref:carbohydrate-binding protein n=1 Tax=Streptomyces sp. NPDC057557 TaxID=3346167 RepID=UPI00369FC369